jgi:membrane protease YdiL (CAAX protease family)
VQRSGRPTLGRYYAFAGLLITALCFWRGNLWANIIAHWLTDGVGFILLPLIGAHH